MGLDIFISTDKHIDRQGKRSSLSRIFLRLVLRQHDDDEEINQISEISGIDLTPLVEMNIPDTSYLEFQLEDTEDEEEIEKINKEIAETQKQYSQDIKLVINRLRKLDQALKENPDYYKQLDLTEPYEAYINYFKNYAADVEPNEYDFIADSETNFGVDIRTIISYLTFAKSEGATKTYFSYG